MRIETDRAPLIAAIINLAQRAADTKAPTMFAGAIASFTNGDNAALNVREAYTISVDCDQDCDNSRAMLEAVLGKATFVIASGGLWRNPKTGKDEEKLHLHWRLMQAARGDDLAKVQQARRMAVTLVGGDPSGISLAHCFRYPGSIHRKGEPRYADIIAETNNEIDLDDAIVKLERVLKDGGVALPAVRSPPLLSIVPTQINDADDEAMRGLPTGLDNITAFDIGQWARPQDVATVLFNDWNADLYPDWTHAALALHSVPYGKQLWMEWSATSPKFRPLQAERKWRQTYPRNAIGIGSILHRASLDVLRQMADEARAEMQLKGATDGR
ncbi:MAG: PriCT-2 domain-containing protein [Beijerinckiaceae bacterium]|nr:PriCT-2 domain-containing protein [Beijerinckiaceae bacterium]